MRAIPQPLKIVAWLFIVSGICAAIKIVFLLLAGHININLGVLSIFVGRGLLRLNPRALTWAMFFTWLGLIFMPIFIAISFFMSGNLTFLGLQLGKAPFGLTILLGIAGFALVYWQYTVLTQPQIRQLFVRWAPSAAK